MTLIENNKSQPSLTESPLLTTSSFSFKKLFSDLAIYSSGNLVIKGMSLISAPIFTRIFEPSQYGAWSFINVVIAFLTGIMLLGGDNAYTRFFFQCKTEEEKQTLSATWFSFLACWSILLLMSILPFSKAIVNWMLDSVLYHQALVVGLISSPPAMMNLILSQALRNRFRAKAFTLLNVLTAALILTLSVIMVVFFNLGVTGALLGTALANIIMVPIRFIFIRDLLRWNFSVSFLKQLLLFGLPLVPMNVAFWLLSNVDRIMLVRLASLEDVGLYSIAAAMAAVLMLLQTAVGQSWQPHAVKLYEENIEDAAKVYIKTMNYLLAASGIIVVGFVALAQEVLFILVPPDYYDSFRPIPFLAGGFLFFTTAQVSSVGIMVKNKTVFIMLACWFVALANLAFNTLFIPLWGTSGAGLATGLAYLCFAGTYYFISQKLWRIEYDVKTIAWLLVVPLLAIVMISIISQSSMGVIINLLFKLLVLTMSGFIILVIISRADNIRMLDILKKVRSLVLRKNSL